MKLDKVHLRQFSVSLIIGFGIVLIVYASFNLYRSLTAYQVETMGIRAQEAEQAGNIEEAIRIRTTIQQTLPDNTDNTLALARLYVLNKNFIEAEMYIKQYTEKVPDSPQGYLLQGSVQLQTGDISAAKQSFTTTYTMNESKEAAYYLAIIAIAEKKDPSTFLETASKEPDQYPDAATLKSSWDKAQDERNPVYKDSLLAFNLLDLNQPHAARLLLTAVIEEEPDYRDGHYLLGVALAETGELTEAINSLNNALAIDPEHQASKDALRVIEEKLGITPMPTSEPTIVE